MDWNLHHYKDIADFVVAIPTINNFDEASVFLSTAPYPMYDMLEAFLLEVGHPWITGCMMEKHELYPETAKTNNCVAGNKVVAVWSDEYDKANENGDTALCNRLALLIASKTNDFSCQLRLLKTPHSRDVKILLLLVNNLNWHFSDILHLNELIKVILENVNLSPEEKNSFMERAKTSITTNYNEYIKSYNASATNQILSTMHNPNIAEDDKGIFKKQKESELIALSQKHQIDIDNLNTEFGRFIPRESIDTPSAKSIHSKH